MTTLSLSASISLTDHRYLRCFCWRDTVRLPKSKQRFALEKPTLSLRLNVVSTRIRQLTAQFIHLDTLSVHSTPTLTESDKHSRMLCTPSMLGSESRSSQLPQSDCQRSVNVIQSAENTSPTLWWEQVRYEMAVSRTSSVESAGDAWLSGKISRHPGQVAD